MDETTQAQNTVSGIVGGNIMCGTITVKPWNYCPDCGQKLEAGWKHCPECGRVIGLSYGQQIGYPLLPTYPWAVPSGPFWYGTFPGEVTKTICTTEPDAVEAVWPTVRPEK